MAKQIQSTSVNLTGNFSGNLIGLQNPGMQIPNQSMSDQIEEGPKMKLKKLYYLIIPVLLLAGLLAGIALAEDGVLFRRNISKTPDAETEKAAIYMMDFYVPAQASYGLVGPVDNYILADDAATVAYEPRDYAKPLVSVYIDDLVGSQAVPEGMLSALGGISFGEFDAFAGVSLDDGTSWKTTNLSRSADLSSFTLANGHAYPGDVHNVVHQVAGDQIFVAWVSKYCDGGTPLYKLDPYRRCRLFRRSGSYLRQGCPLPVRPVRRQGQPGLGELHPAGLPRDRRDPLLLRLDGPRQAAGWGRPNHR
jgi:hypothetical protein